MSTLDVMPGFFKIDSALRPDRSITGNLNLFGLVNRMTFGFTREEYALARARGWTGYLEYHLNHFAIDDSILDARLAGAEFPTLSMTPDQLQSQNNSDTQNQLIRARLLRAVFSRRQLFERVVDMWTDHFNIWLYADGLPPYQKTWDDANVIRPHALATFPEMLAASAHSPAMLEYLNNDTNTAASPNENYAREIMELHTLGVDGGYTQNDVQEVARCFTGWTFWGRNASTPPGLAYTFRYNASNHDNGQKIVLGHIIPAGGGQQDGELVLKILAGHPSTARFIGYKLLRYFWGDNPPRSLVDSLAQVYLATQGDIKAMLRIVFHPQLSPPLDFKFKRPFHLIASALRATGATVTTPGNLQNAMISSGQLPFNWIPPDGYPDSLVAWSGLLLPRWNFGASLMNNEYSGTSVNINTFLAGVPTPLTAANVARRINEALMGGFMPGAELAALTGYLLPDPPTTTRIREAVGLAIGSPAFQWC